MNYKDENIRLVHKDALKPDSLYAKKPLTWYPGRLVKSAFLAMTGEVEHMWVSVDRVDGQNLIGTLANDPCFASPLRHGDEVVLDRSQIEAVFLSLDEWWEEVELRCEIENFFNSHLGHPNRASGFEEFYDLRFTPRQALLRWGGWHPTKDDPLQFLMGIAARRRQP